jgi:hypothetical protein
MRFLPPAAVYRFLLAFLLLAGAAGFGAPAAARAAIAAATAAEFSQPASGVQAPLQHDGRGGAGLAAVDSAWGDADDAKPVLFTPASIDPAPRHDRLVPIGGPPRTIPLSHWPCAGAPTGPPRS